MRRGRAELARASARGAARPSARGAARPSAHGERHGGRRRDRHGRGSGDQHGRGSGDWHGCRQWNRHGRWQWNRYGGRRGAAPKRRVDVRLVDAADVVSVACLPPESSAPATRQSNQIRTQRDNSNQGKSAQSKTQTRRRQCKPKRRGMWKQSRWLVESASARWPRVGRRETTPRKNTFMFLSLVVRLCGVVGAPARAAAQRFDRARVAEARVGREQAEGRARGVERDVIDRYVA